jgi:hypothetical protein
MDVIVVPVRDEDRIDPVEGMIGGVGRIADPGVKDNDLAGFELKLESTVAKPGDIQHCGRSYPLLSYGIPIRVVIATRLPWKS